MKSSNATLLISLAVVAIVAIGIWTAWQWPGTTNQLPAQQPDGQGNNLDNALGDLGNLPNIYEDSGQRFALRYPEGFTVNQTYKYNGMGSGNEILGVSFVIPPETANGTNLSKDTYISVEEIPNAQECSADLFLPEGRSTPVTKTDNGVAYSYGTKLEAAAGNRYEEIIYAIPGTSPCMAIRYFIHYTALENFPQGTVASFDEQSLKTQFDQIRQTLVIKE